MKLAGTRNPQTLTRVRNLTSCSDSAHTISYKREIATMKTTLAKFLLRMHKIHIYFWSKIWQQRCNFHGNKGHFCQFCQFLYRIWEFWG